MVLFGVVLGSGDGFNDVTITYLTLAALRVMRGNNIKVMPKKFFFLLLDSSKVF